MKRLFISQPMKGKTKEEIEQARAEAISAAEQHLGEAVEVIDSYIDCEVGYNPLKCLGRSIEMMADADVVFFAEGWEGARGCRIENRCARDYGLFAIEDYGNYVIGKY